MFNMEHCLHAQWDHHEFVKVAPSVKVDEVNECLQSLRAPSVAEAEPILVSPSGAELEVMHQSSGRHTNGMRARRCGEDGTGEGGGRTRR